MAVTNGGENKTLPSHSPRYENVIYLGNEKHKNMAYGKCDEHRC